MMTGINQNRFAVLPILLGSLGTIALVGCIYIPTFNATIRGKNIYSDVGKSDSRRPAKIGFTLEQVIKTLGPPAYARPDMSAIAYEWTVMKGFWIAPLCGGLPRELAHRVLVLDFNHDRYFASYHLQETTGSELSVIGQAAGIGGPHIPSDMRYYPFTKESFTTKPSTRRSE